MRRPDHQARETVIETTLNSNIPIHTPTFGNSNVKFSGIINVAEHKMGYQEVRLEHAPLVESPLGIPPDSGGFLFQPVSVPIKPSTNGPHPTQTLTLESAGLVPGVSQRLQ
jgi:hypothetical protein